MGEGPGYGRGLSRCATMVGMTTPDIRHELAVAAVGEHLQDYIRHGLPEVGWDGDPWLTLAYNRLQDRYEIWVQDPGRDPVCVMRSRPFSEGGVPSIHELCAKLASHDLRKISESEILRRLDKHNAAIEQAARDKGFQEQAAALEKVYWHVGREIGEYRPVIGMSG